MTPIEVRPKKSTHLPAMTVLASIFGFWLFYVVIVTLRSYVMGFPSQGEMATRRVIVTVVGMLITILVWQAMRLADGRPIGLRIIVAATSCIPASFAFALVNHYFFNIYDPAALIDVEGNMKHLDADDHFWTEFFEVALTRYFFLIGWSSLYLALGYANDVQSAERQSAEYARAAQLSELRALRYQLNPHFLFNTLNSLSSLVMHGRREAAESMILNLATFYRASLASDQTGDISLREEIEVQRLYLDIEAVRFPDRLKVKIDLPDELADWPVPGLILQPLVENAVKHGVARSPGVVGILIQAQEKDGRLILSVSDDAPKNGGGGEPGIGLANVRDRLAARFGSEATMEAGESQGGGYSVTLVLPGAKDD
jgi:two-component system, LytTR family, sensor kinase